jgi:hypothetical protein
MRISGQWGLRVVGLAMGLTLLACVAVPTGRIPAGPGPWRVLQPAAPWTGESPQPTPTPVPLATRTPHPDQVGGGGPVDESRREQEEMGRRDEARSGGRTYGGYAESISKWRQPPILMQPTPFPSVPPLYRRFPHRLPYVTGPPQDQGPIVK